MLCNAWSGRQRGPSRFAKLQLMPSNPTALNPTERFTNRVDDYVKYRPGYPIEIIATLNAEIGLMPDWRVADVGSGPGNLTRLFLDNGNPVTGVEPNDAMRSAGERLLAPYDRFTSVKATAEHTTLADGSVDLIVAGQAFHWFEKEPARAEFRRILKPGGWVALVWNDRDLQADRLSAEYERILCELATEYAVVRDKYEGEVEMAEFLSQARRAKFSNYQVFDREGFLGRALSSSYVPQQGDPGHEEIVAALEGLFEEEQQDGKVRFAYDTQMFYGRLG